MAPARFVYAIMVVGLLLAGAGPVRAHDPYEITVDGWVRADRIDLRIIMAQRTARQACADGRTKLAFTGPEDFEAVRAAFAQAARGLFVVTGGGETIAPREAEANLGIEGDLEFQLVFPRPGRGPIRFDAVHLRRFTDPTYGVVLTLVTDGAFLGQQLLRADESVMEVPLPAAPEGDPAPKS